MESMLHAIRANQQDLVLIDTGGVMSSENENIFRVCDGCIILSSNPEAKAQWRAFASKNGVTVLAELDSVLHGRCELSPATPDGVVRGTISGLERGHTVQSETLEAVASRLRDIIRTNSAEMTEGELLCNINGSTVSQRLLEDEESRKDPFLGIRPAHLPDALRLTQGVAGLEEVRIWNVRASILASAYATSLAGSVSLFDVSKGYIRIPDLTPKGDGHGHGAIEWEVIPMTGYTLVKWKNRRFVTADDLRHLVPPEVDTTKGVVLVSQEPPMWVHATLARAYARGGRPVGRPVLASRIGSGSAHSGRADVVRGSPPRGSSGGRCWARRENRGDLSDLLRLSAVGDTYRRDGCPRARSWLIGKTATPKPIQASCQSWARLLPRSNRMTVVLWSPKLI